MPDAEIATNYIKEYSKQAASIKQIVGAYMFRMQISPNVLYRGLLL